MSVTTVGPVATDGPRLWTWSWYCIVRPATAGVVMVLSILRSASPITEESSVSLFEVGPGSGVSDETVAVLTIGLATSWLAAMCTEMRTRTVAGTPPLGPARGPVSAQVTTCPTFEQVQLPEMDVQVPL